MSKREVVASPEVRKWLTDDCIENRQFYGECKALYKSCKSLVRSLKDALLEAKNEPQVNEHFATTIEEMAAVVEEMRKLSLFKNANPAKELEGHRIALWKSRLLVEKLATAKLANDLVLALLDSPMADSALRLAHLYNDLLNLHIYRDLNSINVFRNTCPMLLHPLRKLSIARILHSLATQRAEDCGYRLTFALLDKYLQPEGEDPAGEGDPNNGTAARNSVSSNTSVEIYRALTKDLNSKAQPLDALWRAEDHRARILLALAARVAPQLLGPHLIIPSRTTGNPRPRTSVTRKLIDHYQQLLWGEVGGYLEHILLWWTPDPLGTLPPSRCHDLRDFLLHLKTTDFIPPLLLPSLDSLLDAMCCHLTSASWDQLFRKTLVSGGTKAVLQAYDLEGSATGHLFVHMLSELIRLSNSCEDLRLDLEDLPVVEQIPILHRLDHSVHMARLWMAARCRNSAARWDLDDFYCTCHTDITNCLRTLATLDLADHPTAPSPTSVHLTVCVKMRAKLVSEIRDNVLKLQRTADHCITVLAKDCRTECLAVLHMSFPPAPYWRHNGPLPDCASDYVESYLDSLLRPVFHATRNMSRDIRHSSSAMVLRILCESWLEYVYLQRIRFSEWGAVQLLTDFGAVPTWLTERADLPRDLLAALVGHEVLKRCEGVGRLLLRRRGESIRMSTALYARSGGDDSSTDNMPAEMHVPNQEQWLDLRAPVGDNICCRL